MVEELSRRLCGVPLEGEARDASGIRLPIDSLSRGDICGVRRGAACGLNCGATFGFKRGTTLGLSCGDRCGLSCGDCCGLSCGNRCGLVVGGRTGSGVALLAAAELPGVLMTGSRGVAGARTVGARKFKDGVRVACGVVREGAGVDGRLIEGCVIEVRGATLCLCGVGVAGRLGAGVEGRLGAGAGRLGAGVAGRLAARCAAAPVRSACPCKGTANAKAITTAKAAEIALKRVFLT